jgi:hypothetical protein
MKTIREALRLASDLLAIGQAILAAVDEDDVERVEAILPARSRTDIAQAAARARALRKFGRPE